MSTLRQIPPQRGVAGQISLSQLFDFVYRLHVGLPSYDTTVSIADKGLIGINEQLIVERGNRSDIILSVSVG